MPDPYPDYFTTPPLYTSARAGVARAGCGAFGLTHFIFSDTQSVSPLDDDQIDTHRVIAETITLTHQQNRNLYHTAPEILDASSKHVAFWYTFDRDQYAKGRQDLIYYANQWGPRDSYGIEIWELLSSNKTREEDF